MSESDVALRLELQTRYSIALQLAIEAHCRWERADESPALCPYHAKMLNVNLLNRTLNWGVSDE
jgi:hypothetical protein